MLCCKSNFYRFPSFCKGGAVAENVVSVLSFGRSFWRLQLRTQWVSLQSLAPVHTFETWAAQKTESFVKQIIVTVRHRASWRVPDVFRRQA